RRDRLPLLRRRPRHRDPHPHGRRQGRDRPRAGRRRDGGGRAAGAPVRGVAGEDEGRGEGDRARLRTAGVVMRVLVLDNYDSFTYNLVQYLGELQAEIQTVRNARATVPERLEMGFERCVISPGPCTPDDAGITLELV